MKLPVSEPTNPFKQAGLQASPDEKQRYALRHGVAHLGVAGDVKRLEHLVHQYGFWECAFATGGAG
jgi:hypothetical protein